MALETRPGNSSLSSAHERAAAVIELQRDRFALIARNEELERRNAELEADNAHLRQNPTQPTESEKAARLAADNQRLRDAHRKLQADYLELGREAVLTVGTIDGQNKQLAMANLDLKTQNREAHAHILALKRQIRELQQSTGESTKNTTQPASQPLSDAKGYWKVLGVNPLTDTADVAEVLESAYRRLARKYHPDTNGNSVAKAKSEAKMRAINEAYAVLKDDTLRDLYSQGKPLPRRRP